MVTKAKNGKYQTKIRQIKMEGVKTMHCPYCGQKASFTSSKDYYGVDYGTNLYVCHVCQARVGTKGNTAKPLGTMANGRLRRLRKRCHKHFDKLWKGKGRGARTKAYLWLSLVMELPKEDAHIGMFDETQCNELLEILEKEYKNLNSKSY